MRARISGIAARAAASPAATASRRDEKSSRRVRGVAGRQTAPADSPIFNPAFDVTPAELISAIITERGVFRLPYNFS